jgi:acetolactate synthase small subunit
VNKAVCFLCTACVTAAALAAGTLSARGFNIESLTVNATNIPDLSRMTIVMRDVPDHKSVQALKQLSDIVNVWAVVDYTGTNSLQRVSKRVQSPKAQCLHGSALLQELVMIKVSYLPNTGNFRVSLAYCVGV